MTNLSTYIISLIQIAGDATCIWAAGKLFKKNEHHKLFFLVNCLAFSILLLDDIYYNYTFRILKLDISLSARLMNMLPLLIFQILQSFNWYYLLRQEKIKIFSNVNLPYLLFSAIAILVLINFFTTTNSLSIESLSQDIFDILSVTLDMSIWFFTIICLGRASNKILALLALGILMISSTDLTMTCLFMVEKDSVATIEWPHIIWTLGTFLTAAGFIIAKNKEKFTFTSPNSVYANCSWWLLISSLLAFVIGFIFYFFLTGIKKAHGIHYALWDMPISLMFTMIAATLLSNRFSKIMLSPINMFSGAVESFNAGEHTDLIFNSNINEFNVLGNFIKKSFSRITEQLNNEIKISAQVAHDIRSPLAALEIVIKSLPTSLDEPKRILLRDAVQHIRDITNTLEKNNTCNNENNHINSTQIADLIDNVISEQRLQIINNDIKINHCYGPESYSYFCAIVPSTMKRIITNLINNSREAINNKSNYCRGAINVNLCEENNYCIINITDNGGGISQKDMSSLFKRGFTTKKSGSGLGLHHAKEMLTEWGGNIQLISQESQTIVKIQIPLTHPPKWFISQLSLTKHEIIVCVDDSISVYRGWQDRLNSLGYNNKLIYCSTKEDFFNAFETLKNTTATYLIDFEFSGKTYQGCDFINEIINLKNINNRIFMVTSHSNENQIQKYCTDNFIQIIPKNFAVKIPLKLFDIKKHLIILASISNIRDGFLDNSEWHFYSNINDLIADIPYFNNNSTIFIQEKFYNTYLDTKLKKHGFFAKYFKTMMDLNNTKLLNS